MKNLWYVVMPAEDVFQGRLNALNKVLEIQEKLKDPEFVRLKCNTRTGHQPIEVFEKPGKATNYFHHIRAYLHSQYCVITLSTSMIEQEILPIMNGVKYE